MFRIDSDIHSLTHFKRNTAELVAELARTGRPVVLTVNGKAAVVVQDAGSYQRLLDRVEAIDGIRHGIEDAEAGRIRPAARGFDRLESPGRPRTGRLRCPQRWRETRGSGRNSS